MSSSKNPNDFSLIGRKPNEILQFKWKSLMIIKIKPELNLKIMLKESKTIKTMKGSKNRRRLTQVKAIFFLHINKQEILICCDNKEIHARKYCSSLCYTFWASYWHIKCKFNWERSFKSLHNWAIYRKDGFISEFSKDVEKEPPGVIYKKSYS